MHRTLSLAAFAAAALLPSCRTFSHQYFLSSDEYELARQDLGSGRREAYFLRSQGRGVLRVETESQRERPFLGLQLVELDNATATRRGVRPYTGLLVTGCYPESAAADAGVLAGDVVQEIDGREVPYLTQAATVEAGLSVGKSVSVRLLRGQSQLDLALTTKVLRETVHDSQEVPLDAVAPQPRPFAGVTLRGIPAPWCERIFGAERNAIVVTDVEVGSPAWLAGIRAGDVIDEVDGAPVPSVAELTKRIAELGLAEQPTQWRVRRESGQFHDATIQLEDYSGEANAWIPLVLHYQNGTFEDRWSLGPFGLLVSNRNRYIPNASLRRTETRNVFSALLGLFRVETTPHESKVRLLWFIHFDT